MTESERLPASFRDPAGFVFRRDGVLYRQIGGKYRQNYDALLTTGLYAALVEERLLIPHVEVAVPPAEPDSGSLVIQPDPGRVHLLPVRVVAQDNCVRPPRQPWRFSESRWSTA